MIPHSFVACMSTTKAASLVLSSFMWSLPKMSLVSSICSWRPACSVTCQYVQCCKFRGNITMVWSKLKHPQSFLSDVLNTVKEHLCQSWDCVNIKYLFAKITCTFQMWTVPVLYSRDRSPWSVASASTFRTCCLTPSSWSSSLLCNTKIMLASNICLHRSPVNK